MADAVAVPANFTFFALRSSARAICIGVGWKRLDIAGSVEVYREGFLYADATRKGCNDPATLKKDRLF